jgi:hypothetical protein
MGVAVIGSISLTVMAVGRTALRLGVRGARNHQRYAASSLGNPDGAPSLPPFACGLGGAGWPG